MTFFIIRHNPDTDQDEVKAELPSYSDAKDEYFRLQGVYPGVELRLVAENEYGRRELHRGYWKHTR